MVAPSGQEAIERPLDVTHLSIENPTDFFDVQVTAEWILRHGYTRIALQFPDSWLSHARWVAQELQKRTQQSLYILADTSYGSCCVDEVASQHVNADCLIHYGAACFSKTKGLPVYYVFGKQDVNVLESVEVIQNTMKDVQSLPILLMYDAAYHHCIPDFYKQLSLFFPHLHCHEWTIYPKIQSESAMSLHPASSCTALPKDTVILYIGPPSTTLSSLLIRHAQHIFYLFNPHTQTCTLEKATQNMFFKRRFFMIQQAKEAMTIGLVVGTLGLAYNLHLLQELQRWIKECGKKSFLISVGKPTPAKLGNFLDVDVFVMVACPENTLKMDYNRSEYMKPVLTPFELLIALASNDHHYPWIPNGQGEEGRYKMEFEEVVSVAKQLQFMSSAEPSFSLVTGQLRGGSVESSNALTQTQHTLSRLHLNTLPFHARLFKGLDPQWEQQGASPLEQGRRGIARGYEGESKENESTQD